MCLLPALLPDPQATLEWVKTNPRLALLVAGLVPLAWALLRRAAIAGAPGGRPAGAAAGNQRLRQPWCCMRRPAGTRGFRFQAPPCPASPPALPCPSAVFGDFGPVLLVSGAIAAAGSLIPWLLWGEPSLCCLLLSVFPFPFPFVSGGCCFGRGERRAAAAARGCTVSAVQCRGLGTCPPSRAPPGRWAVGSPSAAEGPSHRQRCVQMTSGGCCRPPSGCGGGGDGLQHVDRAAPALAPVGTARKAGAGGCTLQQVAQPGRSSRSLLSARKRSADVPVEVRCCPQALAAKVTGGG